MPQTTLCSEDLAAVSHAYFSTATEETALFSRSYNRSTVKKALLAVAAVSLVVLLCLGGPPLAASSGSFLARPLGTVQSPVRPQYQRLLGRKITGRNLPPRLANHLPIRASENLYPEKKLSISLNGLREDILILQELQRLYLEENDALKAKEIAKDLENLLQQDPQYKLDQVNQEIQEAVEGDDFKRAAELRDASAPLRQQLPQYNLAGDWYATTPIFGESKVIDDLHISYYRNMLNGARLGHAGPQVAFVFDVNDRLTDNSGDEILSVLGVFRGQVKIDHGLKDGESNEWDGWWRAQLIIAQEEKVDDCDGDNCEAADDYHRYQLRAVETRFDTAVTIAVFKEKIQDDDAASKVKHFREAPVSKINLRRPGPSHEVEGRKDYARIGVDSRDVQLLYQEMKRMNYLGKSDGSV